MSRTTSKSPARKTSQPASADIPDLVPLGVSIAILLAACYLSNAKNITFQGFTNSLNSTSSFNYRDIPVVGSLEIPVVSEILKLVGTSCSLITTLHVLNIVDQNRSGGFWLNSFVQTVIAASAGAILQGIMVDGKKWTDSFFFGLEGFGISSLFFVWYLVNHDIPFCPANLNIWDKIKDAIPGSDILLGFGTEIFTTNLVITATVKAGFFTEKAGFFEDGWFKAIAIGAIVGTAASFFPFNKGVKFTKSAELTHALAVAFFVASGGFSFIDSSIGLLPLNTHEFFGTVTIGANLNRLIVEPFGGEEGFVLIVTAINYLLGEYIEIAFEGSGVAVGGGFDLFGLMDKALAYCQLA